ncbi:YitT family protein [Bowmanella pacifica]|uniref:Membrane protein n=1 Tax=Bowmanella pacifica TaxID=502051 RepID=A0A917YYM9_9ALTE|nr:YitT family protein [Bowmanella pacifica]GGO70419.1 membrane protein [Bowmanella pacifica]
MQIPAHKIYEDAIALLVASLFVAIGVLFFKTTGLVTGGTSGMALIGAYLSPAGFGVWFFVLNLPFYFLAWRELGPRFTFNTFLAVSLVSVLTDYLHLALSIDKVHPLFAVIAGGGLIGTGLLILFRHQASLGGVGILAYYLQQKYKLRAGTFQLVVDCLILAVAAFCFDWTAVIYSVLGAVIINMLLTINHKPGRYQALVDMAQQAN